MSAAPKIKLHETAAANSHNQNHTAAHADLVAHLRGVALFTDIAKDETAMQGLAAIMQTRRYKSGQDIITEGTAGTELYILIEGQASVYKAPPEGEEYKVAIFEGKQNVSFGESGLIESDLRSATIRADVDCVCLALDRKSFEEFSKERPDWALPVYRRIAHAVMARLKKTNLDMLLLYNALVAEIRGE